MSLSKKN